VTEPDLISLVAAAPDASADERAQVAAALSTVPAGLVLVTCHRAELHTLESEVPSSLLAGLPASVRRLRGAQAARHLVSVAVGVESAVLAEDQVLHQLRAAATAARLRGAMPPAVDRLTDVALAAGRRARSWRPASRRSLADLALDVAHSRSDHPIRTALVVGAGEMGSLAAVAMTRAGIKVSVASPTSANADLLAGRVGGRAIPIDPGTAVAGFDLVIVALRGPWILAEPSASCLDSGPAVVIDLSAPRAAPQLPGLEASGRLVLVDDLAQADDPREARLRPRLEQLVDETVASFDQWLAGRGSRTAAAALAARAEAQRQRALERLWQRLPELDPEARQAIEAMTCHLAEELLREPVTRLATDRRAEPAARELFGL
jgi:glutamyl-tRNA reductase